LHPELLSRRRNRESCASSDVEQSLPPRSNRVFEILPSQTGKQAGHGDRGRRLSGFYVVEEKPHACQLRVGGPRVSAQRENRGPRRFADHDHQGQEEIGQQDQQQEDAEEECGAE